LFHIVDSGERSPQEWLKAHQPQAVLGFDPWLHSHAQVQRWEGVARKQTANLIDMVWKERPAEPAESAFAHPLEYAGEASASKRERVIAAMHAEAQALLITQPEAIMWLLNIRGSDIPFNPLALCYALLERSGRITLISAPRDWPELKEVHHLPLTLFKGDPQSVLSNYARLQLDPGVTVEAIWQAAEQAGCRLLEADDPVEQLKAVKNQTEMEGMRNAHRRDGRALSKFLNWLNEQDSFSELQAAQQLEQFRQEMSGELYRGPSFDTISGAGPNGAIVHYRVTPHTDRQIQPGELYLVDSGGQYPDGTTDVTRTIVHGIPSAEMVDRYTRVLKGHIAVARTIFPRGTTGSQLDALARQYLWEIGEDYAHGTGHGVGSYLCVHEGPQRISKRAGDVPLAPGMVLSNEPGYYKEGEYGIRIENLVLVVNSKKLNYYEFEILTLAPLDERLINRAMLSDAEQRWLDAYHQRVAEVLS